MVKIKNSYPDFLIVGASKCGTTSLYNYLEAHPDIYMSPIKEPNHFCTDINPENFSEEFKRHERQKKLNLESYLAGPMDKKHWGYFVTKKTDYKKLFKNRNLEKAAGEVSNSYLYSTNAANQIRKEIPEARIIIMLRNPADRAYSHYLANLRDGKTCLSFREEIEKDMKKQRKGWGQSYLYLEMGLYYEQVSRYLKIFPTNQVKIYLYEDFKSDTPSLMNDIFKFLQISETSSLTFTEKYNEAKEPVNSRLIYLLSALGIKKVLFNMVPSGLKKKVKSIFFRKQNTKFMSVTDRSYLIEIYREDIIKLSKLIQRDLSSWLAYPNK